VAERLVETGTTEQSDADGQAKSAFLQELTVLLSDQSAANLALSSGRRSRHGGLARCGYQSSSRRQVQADREPMHLALRDRGAEVRRTLDKAILAALKDLQKNGTYKSILNKWASPPAPTTVRRSTERSPELEAWGMALPPRNRARQSPRLRVRSSTSRSPPSRCAPGTVVTARSWRSSPSR